MAIAVFLVCSLRDLYFCTHSLQKNLSDLPCPMGVREHNLSVFNTLGKGSTGMKIAIPKLWWPWPRLPSRPVLTDMRLST
jgi:hypothetical protein